MENIKQKIWGEMLHLFRKNHFSALLVFFSLIATNSSLTADDDCCCLPECNRFYVGGFGGGLYSYSTRITQTGVAFFTEAEGGPLAVDARGHSNKTSSGFGGAQIGYEWSQSPWQFFEGSCWSLAPAVEAEAFFYRHTKRGSIFNPTVRLPEHDFHDSFPMSVGVYVANGVLTFNNFGCFSPYVGGGIGAARISIRKARSFQVEPPEAGINHFNSDRSDSAWTFAAQAKAGIRYNIWERFHLFAEYRFLYLDSSRYVFGATNYPNHVPTTTWNVDVKNICYNAFTIGLQLDL